MPQAKAQACCHRVSASSCTDDEFDVVPSEDLGRALLAGRWIGIAMGTIVVEVQMEWKSVPPANPLYLLPEVISSRRGFTPSRSVVGVQGTRSRLVPRAPAWLSSRAP